MIASTLIFILELLSMISFFFHMILFYYLEISNNYDSYPMFKINFEMFTYYFKKVKDKDIMVVKVSNFLLKLAGIFFLSTIVLFILTLLFSC